MVYWYVSSLYSYPPLHSAFSTSLLLLPPLDASPADQNATNVQLLGLLIALLLCLRRRKRRNNRDSASSFAAGERDHDRGMFGIFPNRNSTHANGSSEKGLLKSHGGPAAASTPTMGGDTLYSGHGRSTEGTGLGLTSAAALGAGAGDAGMRNSGVVLPRVKDENQSGDRWIETGAEVSVLWP